MIKVAGHLAKSSEVMKLVNDMIKLPVLRQTMMEMSKGGASGALRQLPHCSTCRLVQACLRPCAAW
jgi:hypothetical protein